MEKKYYFLFPRDRHQINSSAFLSRRLFEYFLPIASTGAIFAAKWSKIGRLEGVVSKSFLTEKMKALFTNITILKSEIFMRFVFWFTKYQVYQEKRNAQKFSMFGNVIFVNEAQSFHFFCQPFELKLPLHESVKAISSNWKIDKLNFSVQSCFLKCCWQILDLSRAQ